MSKERHDKLFFFEKHKTPKDVARFMRKEGKGVGREYETHGDVWDASDSLLQVGLLHLILDRLDEISNHLTSPKDQLEIHRQWIRNGMHEASIEVIKDYKKELTRISKFCDLELLGKDARSTIDIHDLSKEFRSSNDWVKRTRSFEKLKDLTGRLRYVRSLDDITRLDGIGKIKASKIRQIMIAKNETKPSLNNAADNLPKEVYTALGAASTKVKRSIAQEVTAEVNVAQKVVRKQIKVRKDRQNLKVGRMECV